MSCYPTLVFYLVPAQLPLPLLPLQGSAPLTGASACLTPVCWSTPGVGLEGSLLRHLVFSRVPCSSSGPACSVRCFPCCRFPWGFQVTGCLSFCFPGDVGWASALPFFFYTSPAPLACRGSRGYAPCVRVLPLRWCLLGFEGEVTLLPFLYLRVGVLLACGSSGVRGSSRPWVRGRVLWPLDGPGT